MQTENADYFLKGLAVQVGEMGKQEGTQVEGGFCQRNVIKAQRLKIWERLE